DCNDSFAHLLGYESRADVMAQPTWNLYSRREDREAFLAALQRTGVLTNYEQRMRRKDGRPIWALLNTCLLTDAEGRPVLEGTLVDISGRKESEEATLLSASRYRTLIESMAQGVFLKDRDLRYVLANRPFYE